MSASLKIDMPGVDFEQMAREAVAVHLTEALVGAKDTVRKIVVAAMAQKVNERGVVSQSSYENRTSFVEWMVQDLVRSVTGSILKERVEQLRPEIEKQIEAELKRNVKSAAKVLTEGFISNARYGPRMDINVSMAVREDR